MKQQIFLYFLLSFVLGANAQNYKLQLLGTAADIQIFRNATTIDTNYNSELAIQDFLQQQIQALKSAGYITCNIDSLQLVNNTYNAHIYIGKKYKWATLKAINIPSVLLSNIGMDNVSAWRNQPISYTQYALLCKKILRYAEDNGYPFANVQLQNISINDSSIGGDIIYLKNKKVVIDSINILGDAGMNLNYVHRYFGLKEGDLYNESALRNITKLLQNHPFLQEGEPWVVSFSANNTILNIYLKERNANRADAVIGFLPNNTQVGGKLLVTGDIKLNLWNSLNYGEQLILNWQNLQFKSPRLLVEANLPYVLGTAFGFSAKFNYLKNDTTFRTTNGEIGVQYLLNANQQLKLFYSNASSRLLNINTNEIINNRKLPQNVDFKTQSFGLAWMQNHTDNRLNPRKGLVLNIEGAASIKNLLRNNGISDLIDPVLNTSFNYLYDSIAEKSYKYQLHGALNYYVPIGKNVSLKSSYNGGWVYNPYLFRNELFQIGGYKFLRGFDEASLYTNQYHVLGLEPHYSISKNSYFLLLADAGNISLPFATKQKNNFAYAFGTGLNLETKNGAFNIIYAVSNNLSNGVALKNGKIHFGYVNNF